MRISEVLQAKPSQDVITISPDAGVRELIALLDERNIGALPEGDDDPDSPRRMPGSVHDLLSRRSREED